MPSNRRASAPKTRPNDSQAELAAARKVAQIRKRPLFVWAEVRDNIDWDYVAQLRNQLEGVDDIPELDILLHSSGGDIHSAYRCLRIFRRKAKKLNVLVPFWAKSAATFICLGADEILMGKDGELGPLDAQMNDPEGSEIPLSALNEFKSLEYIRNYAIETHDVFFFHLRRKSTMDIPHALNRAEKMVGAFSGPLFSQVQSRALGQYRRLLGVAEDYARLVMKRWGYASLGEDGIKEIVRKLVWEYPAHEYVIDLTEAQAIGLKAKPLEGEVEGLAWKVVENHRHIFELVIPDKVATAPSTEAAPTVSMVKTAKTAAASRNGGSDARN